jgi:hypothetical protein
MGPRANNLDIRGFLKRDLPIRAFGRLGMGIQSLNASPFVEFLRGLERMLRGNCWHGSDMFMQIEQERLYFRF